VNEVLNLTDSEFRINGSRGAFFVILVLSLFEYSTAKWFAAGRSETRTTGATCSSSTVMFRLHGTVGHGRPQADGIAVSSLVLPVLYQSNYRDK
jgi:hypothetical protein